MDPKSLHNTDINGASKNVSDLKVFGDGDAWLLICKASSEAQGWMKSTKVMPIGEGHGCLVQVTTQQRNSDGSYAVAEALTFVPGVQINTRWTGDPGNQKPTDIRYLQVAPYKDPALVPPTQNEPILK